MSLDQLKQDIESRTFRRIYYLYGAEPYLKRFYLNSLLSAILPGTADADLHRYEGKGLDVGIFSEELWLCPMGEYKVMQINDLPSSAPVTEFLADEECEIGEDTVVVIYQQTETPDNRVNAFKALKKRLSRDGLLVEICTVDDATLARWVTQQFRRRGCTIAPAEVSFFLSVEERNMESMLTEIDKIAAYCGDTVTREALEKLCVRTIQARALELNDLLLQHDADGVFSTLNDLNALRIPPHMILGSLFSCFSGLYRLKLLENVPESQRIELSGLPPFVARKQSRAIAKIPLGRLECLMDACARTDVAFKSTSVDEQLLIVQLLNEALEVL